MYVLLNENYVEDDDNMFRFDYRYLIHAVLLYWFYFFLMNWHNSNRNLKKVKLGML